MADAVIIDDGGSTRIKQLKGDEADGKMDDLISEKTDQAKGTFATLRDRLLRRRRRTRTGRLTGT